MNFKRLSIVVLLGAAAPLAGFGATWSIDLPSTLADQGTVRIGLADLREAMGRLGHTLATAETPAPSSGAVRVRIDPDFPEKEGFEWRSDAEGATLTASTPLGAGYGLCRMAWLCRVEGAFPPADRREAPVLPHRLYSAGGAPRVTYEGPAAEPDDIAETVERFRKELGHAVRLGYNRLVLLGLEHYVPWDDPHYGPRAERYRAHLLAMIAEAHSCGLEVLLGGDEAVYLPSDLETRGASPSVKDPLFWEALQDKYRRLLTALPELDGVVTRTGEQQPALDFRHIDIVYSRETSPDPRMEERYTQFLKSVHGVVAGEFGKLYVHRTWAVGDWGHHSVPEIYTRSLTDDVPTENFIASIKATKQDQWFYGVAFNPTFGLTPHTTIVEGELHNQYHGGGTLLDYPGRWLAAAMAYARLGGAQGIFARQNDPEETTPSAILHLFSRLGWEDKPDTARITREWAAHRYGSAAAESAANLFLDSAAAIEKGYYLRPLLTVGWNPIPLIRTNQFVAQGNALFDSGRGHDEFLRRHYLMCKPFFEETYAEIGEGADRMERMGSDFVAIRDRIDSAEAAADLEQLILHSRSALALVRDYYRTMLSYGAYSENHSPENRDRLERDSEGLAASLDSYRAEYDYYRTAGAEILMELAKRSLEDPESARKVLEEAPTPEALRARFDRIRDECIARLSELGDRARRVLSWRGTVDFRILIHAKGTEVRYEILRGMAVGSPTVEFDRPIPEEKGGEWLVKPIDVPAVAAVLSPPAPENDFTLTLFVENPTPGSAHFAFELYWAPEGD